MYDLNDTIVAVSSASSGARAIVRISGPETIDVCEQIFEPQNLKFQISNLKSQIAGGSVTIDDELRVDAKLYLFVAPHSYTGETLAEIHIHANRAVTEALVARLQKMGLRMAGPGEFTARAYLNGKIDLAQAEAVNEIIVSSNRFQLAAAEKLLSGRLAETTAKVRSQMMDCLGLIEAGLDFSDEDIEFISDSEAVERLSEIKQELEQLLMGSISYESLIDLPAVGIAGAPNAGKSSLLNRLLGNERSIVSSQRKTTRDVLTGILTLVHNRCVLFDCAGLTRPSCPVPRAPRDESVLDELAQQAAIDALRNSSVVLFCVDAAKDKGQRTEDRGQRNRDLCLWAEEISLWSLVGPDFAKEPQNGSPVSSAAAAVILVATKSDLLSEKELANRLVRLSELFRAEFIATSSENGAGLDLLRGKIDTILNFKSQISSFETRALPFSESPQDSIGLTARHKQAVTEAIENVSEAINELKAGDTRSGEVIAMLLRAAYQSISDIEQAQCVAEQVLEDIFKRFCIGK